MTISLKDIEISELYGTVGNDNSTNEEETGVFGVYGGYGYV